MSPQNPLKRCRNCRELFQPGKIRSEFCSEPCRAACAASRRYASLPKTPEAEWLDKRVRLTLDDPRTGENRLGTVIASVIVDRRPLLTVQLDRAGWPGGNHGGHPPAGWYVELRPDEVEVL